jgi:multicomponent Na+:H+ antiporter subunit E
VLLALISVWILLWGELSVGNVVSGLAVSVALLVVFPLDEVPHVDHRIRPVALLRLLVHFVTDLVLSTVSVARDVLLRPHQTRTAIVACPLRVDAPGLVTFLANTIALSPGTMPVHLDHEPLVLYVHVLRLDSAEAVRARVSRLEELAVAALGSSQMVAACQVPPPAVPGAHR